MSNLDLGTSIADKFVIGDSTATAPKDVHLTDLFVGDACTILDIDRPVEDQGSAEALIPKYSLLLSTMGFNAIWTPDSYAIYKGLTNDEVASFNVPALA